MASRPRCRALRVRRRVAPWEKYQPGGEKYVEVPEPETPEPPRPEPPAREPEPEVAPCTCRPVEARLTVQREDGTILYRGPGLFVEACRPGCPGDGLEAEVKAWRDGPERVKAETRPDPILPTVKASKVEVRERRGRLAIGGLTDGREPRGQLPLIAASKGPRVPQLEMADSAGVPTMARGRGAPLELRLAVGACLLTPLDHRTERRRLVVTVRELRDFLFPRGWERGRDWPRIREALRTCRDYTIPVGRGGFWYPLALRYDPGSAATLDEEVWLDVELPSGAATGPLVDRRALALLGVESAPRFRAYIAAHAVCWIPGRTRVPYPGGGPPRLWTGDASRYPVLTRADRRRLAFGNDAKNRTRGEQDGPWEDLPGVEIVSRKASTADGRRGWLVVPEDAAVAIRGGR